MSDFLAECVASAFLQCGLCGEPFLPPRYVAIAGDGRIRHHAICTAAKWARPALIRQARAESSA
jgi:hypothetical protein